MLPLVAYQLEMYGWNSTILSENKECLAMKHGMRQILHRFTIYRHDWDDEA